MGSVAISTPSAPTSPPEPSCSSLALAPHRGFERLTDFRLCSTWGLNLKYLNKSETVLQAKLLVS